jgi:Domain of unknown function (DUF3943)
MNKTRVRRAALGAVAALSLAGAVSADDKAASESKDHWHLYGGLGYGDIGGGYGDFLKEPIQFELRISKATASGAWRFGGGLQFGSNDMADSFFPPALRGDHNEWAHFETFGSVTRYFNPGGRLRPYLQGRIGIVRVHPRSPVFNNKPPEEVESGDSPTLATNGVGFTVQPGFEFYLGKTLSLDVGAFWNWYKTGEYDLTPLGLEPTSDGMEWGVRAGLAWQPFAETPAPPAKAAPPRDASGKLLPLPPADDHVDGWGVRRSWGWATAEMFAINYGASMFNEYVRDANFNQISPRSFWENFQEGFTYDDNKFKTNQLIHPFNGATYYNAARANGIGFWGSSAMSIAGAFVWECCGETHPMSFNDMISTGIGGIARGEVMYRASSLLLDNTKTGKNRFFREAGGMLINPIREFNRLVTGDAGEVRGNPVDPYDWRPEFQFLVRAGGRVMGEGESISENTNTYGFLELVLAYGNPWDTDRHGPYERFDVTSQSNFGDKTRMGRLLIRGDLFTKRLGDGRKHVLTLQQDFDYIDNEAFEYGGQSLGPALLSRFQLSDRYNFITRLQAYGIILGAVNSDYSQLADVANQERLREYDYGPGVGFSAEGYLNRNGRVFINGRYRYSWIDVSNGSLYSGANVGLGSSHNVHQAQLRLEIPFTRTLAIGADASLFFRRSHYDVTSEFSSIAGRRTITQRNPEARVYLSWLLNHPHP